METIFIGKNFVELREIDSTNAWCERQSSPLPEGTVVWAHSQTDGKGQRGNTWESAPDQNLTFSLVLRPTFLKPEAVFDLNKLLSCALFDALASHLPEGSLLIKWPNDLLVNRRKVCGMLLQNHFSSASIRQSIIGIGLNVNQQEFPEAIAQTATSLALETGNLVDRKALLLSCLSHIEKEYLALRAGKRDALDRRYLKHLYAYQEPTRVRIEGKECTVVPVGVERSGRLAIEMEGRLRYFGMKEIEFLL